jgi:hypothetical protein
LVCCVTLVLEGPCGTSRQLCATQGAHDAY